MLQNQLNNRVKNGSSRIIWAFDETMDAFSKFYKIFNQIRDDIAAVKFNRQLILPYGLNNENLLKILSTLNNEEIPVIMDAKINDYVANEFIAKSYFEVGFDAVICTPFIGEAGLKPIISSAKDLNKDFIFLTYMSHPSADYGYGRKVLLNEQEKNEIHKDTAYFYELFAHLANKTNASGCIVGATYPEIIQETKKILQNNKIIISPGIGAQGGNIQKCRKMGMDFAIIGRSLNQNSNPSEYISSLNEFLQ